MDFAEFRASLSQPAPPAELSASLRALWLDAKGDFDAAHNIAQDIDDAEGARIHAYLHRKEGDLSNARYWYQQAGIREQRGPLEAEWASLVSRHL